MYVSSVTTTQGKRQNSHSRATCSAILFEYPPPSRQSASHVLETKQCRRFWCHFVIKYSVYSLSLVTGFCLCFNLFSIHHIDIYYLK